jgi:hypothetical protein
MPISVANCSPLAPFLSFLALVSLSSLSARPFRDPVHYTRLSDCENSVFSVFEWDNKTRRLRELDERANAVANFPQ